MYPTIELAGPNTGLILAHWAACALVKEMTVALATLKSAAVARVTVTAPVLASTDVTLPGPWPGTRTYSPAATLVFIT
jgi:hypothetical protein